MSTWQTLIFAAATFGYACIAFEFITHPYHLLEHHASFLTIKYGTKVTKFQIFQALFGWLHSKHPSYAAIMEHHAGSMGMDESSVDGAATNNKKTTTKVTPLISQDSVNFPTSEEHEEREEKEEEKLGANGFWKEGSGGPVI